uniref:Uncharacterized protein n=1 Tax=Echeneis naucrates TaxID=173247 RepID=A0A665VQC5_ECHNA
MYLRFIFLQNNGHSEDILCMAQSPPTLLATGSYDGEIILWNMVSGSIQCRFVSPRSAEHQNAEGDFKLSERMMNALESFGSRRCAIHLSLCYVGLDTSVRWGASWSVCAGKCTNTVDDVEHSSVLPSPILSQPSLFLSSLQIVDNDQVVLTSSPDYTVRLWSTRGEFIGTFGQSECWSIHISSTWMHPAVPYELLIHPASLPEYESLNVETHLSDVVSADKTAADCGELKVSWIILQMII